MGNLIFTTSASVIRKSNFEDAPSVVELFIDQKKNIDVWMDAFIKQHLQPKFDNIFLPATFGDNACDFLGLRLALHIRTTDTINKFSNIYIYGPEAFDEIAAFSSLYQILLMPRISLIDFSLTSIAEKLNSKLEEANHLELMEELKKIRMEIPENYFDSHSISNVWGLYRLCEVAGIDTATIPSLKNQEDKINHIYFKWLLATSKITGIRSEEVLIAEKNYASPLKGLTVLGKIELPPNPKKKNR